MKIRDEDIVGTLEGKDGNTYIFLADKSVYKRTADGKLSKYELNKKNSENLRKNMELGSSDIVR